MHDIHSWSLKAKLQGSEAVYLGGGMVQHLLPGWIHGVPVGQEPLLCHVHHLPGRSVHGHSPLIPQSCLLGLLLGLGGGGTKNSS